MLQGTLQELRGFKKLSELQNVNIFTQIKSFKLNFTPKKMPKSEQFKMNEIEINGAFWVKNAENDVKQK